MRTPYSLMSTMQMFLISANSLPSPLNYIPFAHPLRPQGNCPVDSPLATDGAAAKTQNLAGLRSPSSGRALFEASLLSGPPSLNGLLGRITKRHWERERHILTHKRVGLWPVSFYHHLSVNLCSSQPLLGPGVHLLESNGLGGVASATF